MTQSITAETAQYAVHFGVVPEIEDLNYASVSIDLGIGFRRAPEAARKEEVLWDEANSIAFLTGSWGCWGEHDQDTDGDFSLHIVVYVNHPGQSMAESIANLRSVIQSGIAEGRLLDWAIVSSAVDWSQQTHTVTFDSRNVIVREFGHLNSMIAWNA